MEQGEKGGGQGGGIGPLVISGDRLAAQCTPGVLLRAEPKLACLGTQVSAMAQPWGVTESQAKKGHLWTQNNGTVQPWGITEGKAQTSMFGDTTEG